MKVIIVKWKTHIYKRYYFIDHNKKNLLFADDKVTIADSMVYVSKHSKNFGKDFFY